MDDEQDPDAVADEIERIERQVSQIGAAEIGIRRDAIVLIVQTEQYLRQVAETDLE